MKTTITALLITACGANVPDARPDSGPEAPSIAGHWESECLPNEREQFFRLIFDLTDTDWELDYVVHGDAACSVPLVTVHVEGAYELTAPSLAVPGAWEARFGFDAKTITPHADPIRDYLASIEGCGAAEWQTGVAQDVYQTGCSGFGQYPRERCDADYDLVRLEGGALSFGQRPADNDMCTPERRPTAISPVALARD